MAVADVLLFCLFGILWGSRVGATPPSSFAHVWPGQPATPFGPGWQDCECLYAFPLSPASHYQAQL